MNKKIARISLFLILGVLFITTLACKQAGEIVPDSVATQRALPSPTPTQNLEELAGAEFTEGDTVMFIGKGFLIPLYENPGDDKVISHAPRNDTGTVTNIQFYDGTLWYQVKSVGGTGWVALEFLQAPE